MPIYPTNPALEAAVIANAEDDTPRLAYADWLDENGDPDRAAFIRTQVALWDKHPADQDYVEMREQYLDVQSLMSPRRQHPSLPPEVGFHDSSLDGRDDSGAAYHRGFAYFGMEPSASSGYPDETHARRLRDILPELIRTTTIRGFNFSRFTCYLPTLLESEACCELSALALHYFGDASPDAIATLAASGAAGSLQWLALNPFRTEFDGGALTTARFPQLRRLDAYWWPFEGETEKQIAATNWFGQLHHLCLGLPAESVGILDSLGAVSCLHTLQSYRFPVGGVASLVRAGEFKSLGRLFLQSNFRGAGAETLARAQMPSLSVLELQGGMRNDDLSNLTGSNLFAHLTGLSLGGNEIGDRGVKAIAGSPSATTLRRLSLGGNSFGPGGLKTLAKPDTFPRLLSLDLGSATKRKATETDLAAFLTTLSIPEIRHLDLSGWPVGDRGARALASNPAFGNLTRLGLNRCAIGKEGLDALTNSPHLARLVYLAVSFNPCEMPDSFLDSGVLPNLAECWVTGKYGNPMRDRLSNARPSVAWI